MVLIGVFDSQNTTTTYRKYTSQFDFMVTTNTKLSRRYLCHELPPTTKNQTSIEYIGVSILFFPFWIFMLGFSYSVGIFVHFKRGNGGGGLRGCTNEGPHSSQRDPIAYKLLASYVGFCLWSKGWYKAFSVHGIVRQWG